MVHPDDIVYRYPHSVARHGARKIRSGRSENYNWSESSRTAVFFTERFGKLPLVDKGGRSAKSKRGPLDAVRASRNHSLQVGKRKPAPIFVTGDIIREFRSKSPARLGGWPTGRGFPNSSCCFYRRRGPTGVCLTTFSVFSARSLRSTNNSCRRYLSGSS